VTDFNGEAGSGQERKLSLVVSDQSQLRFLEASLRGFPGLQVARVPSAPAAGRLGVGEVIEVVASSSGLVAAIRTLPDFLKARRSDIKITCSVEHQALTVEISNANVEEILPALERILHD
jgi:Effector Associated Constant Component 1